MQYTYTSPRLFFDIETVASEKAVEFLPKPEAPSNWKDPNKIAQYVQDKQKEMLEKATLDMDSCMVDAIAVKSGDDEIQTRLRGEEGSITEHELITWFWQLFSEHDGRCCGYYVINFDLPVLMRRSFDLGIKPDVIPGIMRYRTDPVLDLCMVMNSWQTGEKGRGLKWICERYGIPNDMPDANGSQYAEMTPQTRKAYVSSDVKLTYALYNRMKGIYFDE